MHTQRELTVLNASGQRVWVEWSLVLARSEDGSPIVRTDSFAPTPTPDGFWLLPGETRHLGSGSFAMIQLHRKSIWEHIFTTGSDAITIH